MGRLRYPFLLVGIALIGAATGRAQVLDSTQLIIRQTTDFGVTGTGDDPSWAKTDWTVLPNRKSTGNAPAPATRAKLLYSATGIYALFQCDDERLTASIREDFGALYTEDVVELFLWPDQSVPIYFEYELSPLNYELPILVPNVNGKFMGWRPWHYTGDQTVKHATSVQGGEKASRDRVSNAPITGWTAEFFIPFRLLSPLVQAPPVKGTQWRGNLYRLDYDRGMAAWSWQKTNNNFHEFKKFGTLIFD